MVMLYNRSCTVEIVVGCIPRFGWIGILILDEDAGRMGAIKIEDGLESLQRHLNIKDAAALIEKTAVWVAPETFKILPLWYPEYGRRDLLYKGYWSVAQHNKNRKTQQSVHKTEGNVYASKALNLALNIKRPSGSNWSCCHIWGLDDPKFQRENSVVSDRKFYSCIGNMVLLPTPLKAFTDSVPKIKAMIRVCALNLYGWSCDHPDVSALREAVHRFSDWDAYPDSWPRSPNEKKPLGVSVFSDDIKKSAKKRAREILRDLDEAGPHYPREGVHAALEYWKIDLKSLVT